jgi:hypothetical protein
MTYWVKFAKPVAVTNPKTGATRFLSAACIHTNYDIKDSEARYEDARARASKFGPVKEILSLPYGASPSLDGAEPGDFCYSPALCAGHTSCPKSYACSE